MGDRVRHFNTEKKSSSVPKADLTRSHYQEKSESQRRDEKRNSAASSQGRERLALASGKAIDRQARQKQQSGDKKRKSAINPDKGGYRAKSSSTTEKISTRSQNRSMYEIQRRTDQLTLGTKKERSRATSSLRWGTQGRRLRGGMEKEDTSEQQGEAGKNDDTNKQQEDEQQYQKFQEILKNRESQVQQLKEINEKQSQPWKPEFRMDDFYRTPDLNDEPKDE